MAGRSRRRSSGAEFPPYPGIGAIAAFTRSSGPPVVDRQMA
jgi:hypothetical protein